MSVTLHDKTLIVYQSATVKDISFQQIRSFGWNSVLPILHDQNKTGNVGYFLISLTVCIFLLLYFALISSAWNFSRDIITVILMSAGIGIGSGGSAGG